MPVKNYKPTSPGRRNMSVLSFEEITTDKPEKSLLAPLKRKGGRNNMGRITTRHQGGGHKKRYRIIDFKRDKFEVPARWQRLNMTPTVAPGSACCTTSMGKSVTSSHRLVCR